MNIQVIEEHSVDLDLLPKKADILDAGCRGFGFTNYFRERGHEVLAIDIDELEGNYKRIGLAHFTGISTISNDSDPQARHIVGGYETTFARPYLRDGLVHVFSLKDFNRNFHIIKLDIEGAEYEILKQAQHPVAKQISVEFHAHCGIQTKEMLDSLLLYLSEWYTIHGAVWESRHGCSENYWDILLVSK